MTSLSLTSSLTPSPAPARLADLSVVVTGAAQGIGLGIARHLAAQGCRVSLWDLDGEAAQTAASALQQDGAQAQACAVDVSSEEQVQQALERTQQAHGQVDVLVNNAGIGGERLMSKLTLDFWNRVMQVNLSSQFLCSKAVLPGMVERGFGRIINLSSRAWLGNRGQASYAASKGAVVSFTRSLALEYARHGITANAIAPGIVQTPLFDTLKDEVQQGLRQTVPMQRIGQPDDVAQAVRFFADPASGYITGQLLYVCGGRSLSSPSA